MPATLPIKTLIAAPPMGWNSWDAYGTSVVEDEVKTNAVYMAKNLASFGWQYVVVDIQWTTPQPQSHGYIDAPNNVTLDEYGRLVPAPNRFPSASNGAGFKPLADFVHSLGLKFGIHIMRGIPRQAVALNLPIQGSPLGAADIADREHVCHWKNMTDMYGINHALSGGQAYYDSIANLYAGWGVDFVKADDMSQSFDPGRPYHQAEIEALSRALAQCGRPVVLSLSPGPAPIEQAAHLRAHAHMWRISGDFWDDWAPLKSQFERVHLWEGEIGPGAFPDADMLPLGRIGIRAEVGDDRSTHFSADEQRSMMTLWCICRSALMFGGDLPSCDPATLALICNSEVLQVNQHSSANHQSYDRGGMIAWIADLPDSGGHYLAVFNLNDEPQSIDLAWAELGLQDRRLNLRDLWQHADLGPQEHLALTLNAHACELYRVSSSQ